MLRFTSCQGDSTDSFCKDLAAFIGEELSKPSEYIDDIPWQERERLLDRGEIQVGWIGSVRSDLRSALRRAFLRMDKNPRGEEILRAARMLRFVAVSDREYASIREMERVAEFEGR